MVPSALGDPGTHLFSQEGLVVGSLDHLGPWSVGGVGDPLENGGVVSSVGGSCSSSH